MYIIVIYEDLDIDHLPSQVINGQCYCYHHCHC